MSTKHVVILGAGPGGLASALLLANAGVRVTLLEKQRYVGGRTSGWSEAGYTFDRGPTFFLYPRILQEIFAQLGRDLFTEIPMKRLDPQYRLVFGGGGQLDATPDRARLREQVALLCPEDAPAVDRFLEDNRRKLDGFSPILENEFSSWKQLLSPAMLSLLPLVRMHTSVETDLRRFFRDPRVRLSFSFQSKYLGMSPFQCPSLFTILSFLEYEYGVYHPYGGCHRVSERMAEIAREMGVDIRLEHEVEELRFEKRKVRSVRAGQEWFDCDAIVINADFARAMERLVPDTLRPTWNDKKLARAKYSCSTYMLYLGVRGKVDLPHHVIYFSEDYQQNLKDITEGFCLSKDPSLYVQNASVTDEGLAPPGCSALYVLVPVPHVHPNLNWAEVGARVRQQALDGLRKLGIEDLENRIVVEKTCSPADWQAQEIYRGATFSLAHTLDQMLFLRPQNRFGDLEGVYLVGGGTHPGSGLPVIYSSARITSKALLADLAVSTREVAWTA
jgi:phytoene desaturase